MRDATGELLFHPSRRGFPFGMLQAGAWGCGADPERLCVGATSHDLGLTPAHRRDDQRFELDGADEARRFLASHGVGELRTRLVQGAIALHTTPEVPSRLEPEAALVTAGVETDVRGIGHRDLDHADVAAVVVAAHPRPGFERAIVDAFAAGLRHRPDTTFGTVNGDVLEHRVPGFRHVDFVQVIEDSPWPE